MFLEVAVFVDFAVGRVRLVIEKGELGFVLLDVELGTYINATVLTGTVALSFGVGLP